MILHGAGSAKESHFDFARGCRADGIAALAYDARGHGDSDGSFGPGSIDDALAMVALLRAHAPRVALRGSSMGGFQAIHAGARDPSVCAVVAICPARSPACCASFAPASGSSSHATRGVRALARVARPLRRRRRARPRDRAAAMHARGDEQVPYAVSEQLYEAAHEPKRLLLMPGGHHRSVQHDLELQAVSRSSSATRRAGRLGLPEQAAARADAADRVAELGADLGDRRADPGATLSSVPPTTPVAPCDRCRRPCRSRPRSCPRPAVAGANPSPSSGEPPPGPSPPGVPPSGGRRRGIAAGTAPPGAPPPGRVAAGPRPPPGVAAGPAPAAAQQAVGRASLAACRATAAPPPGPRGAPAGGRRPSGAIRRYAAVPGLLEHHPLERRWRPGRGRAARGTPRARFPPRAAPRSSRSGCRVVPQSSEISRGGLQVGAAGARMPLPLMQHTYAEPVDGAARRIENHSR